jgi:predicted O-methyltransferase YrrM
VALRLIRRLDPSGIPPRATRSGMIRPVLARLRMATSLWRLTKRDDPPSRAIAAALKATALGRIPSEERGWIAQIERRRGDLGSDKTVTDPEFHVGARPEGGFFAALHRPVAVSDASSLVSISPLWGVFLMRIVRELAPRSCLELGTGLGLSGAYQGAALELNGVGKLTTLEGNAEWATIAERGFSTLGLGRVKVRPGPLGETLDETLAQNPPVDFVFVDAEHGQAAILGYFRTMLPHLADRGAIIVFDDINFSREMRSGWRAIRGHERVSLSVGLGRVGIAVVSRR